MPQESTSWSSKIVIIYKYKKNYNTRLVYYMMCTVVCMHKCLHASFNIIFLRGPLAGCSVEGSIGQVKVSMWDILFVHQYDYYFNTDANCWIIIQVFNTTRTKHVMYSIEIASFACCIQFIAGKLWRYYNAKVAVRYFMSEKLTAAVVGKLSVLHSNDSLQVSKCLLLY